MEKQRKYKTFSIIALMFAVVALSVGFAAFQKVLNISSSAQVSLPSEDNFKLTIYGYIDESEAEKTFSGTADFTKWSKEVSYAMIGSDFLEEYSATIDNNNLTINIDNINFNKSENVSFAFLIKNESDFGVYLSLEQVPNATYMSNEVYRLKGTCTSNNGLTSDWVDTVCDNIYLDVFIGGIQGRSKLLAGRYTVVLATVVYSAENNDYVQEQVNVDFPEMKILFDSVPFY